MDAIIEAQLNEYRLFLVRFKDKDEKIEKIFESGEEPDEKTTTEFAKLQEEYIEFSKYFEKYDANYWGGYLSLTDMAKKVFDSVYA